jgi:hypothetical protein
MQQSRLGPMGLCFLTMVLSLTCLRPETVTGDAVRRRCS